MLSKKIGRKSVGKEKKSDYSIKWKHVSGTRRLLFLVLSRVSNSISGDHWQTPSKRTDCTHRSIPVIRRQSRFEDSQDCKAQENYSALTIRSFGYRDEAKPTVALLFVTRHHRGILEKPGFVSRPWKGFRPAAQHQRYRSGHNYRSLARKQHPKPFNIANGITETQRSSNYWVPGHCHLLLVNILSF